jgi:hypothetical protein
MAGPVTYGGRQYNPNSPEGRQLLQALSSDWPDLRNQIAAYNSGVGPKPINPMSYMDPGLSRASGEDLVFKELMKALMETGMRGTERPRQQKQESGGVWGWVKNKLGVDSVSRADEIEGQDL